MEKKNHLRWRLAPLIYLPQTTLEQITNYFKFPEPELDTMLCEVQVIPTELGEGSARW